MNGNEPTAESDTVMPKQTGQIRANENSACSVNAMNDDDDDGTTVGFDGPTVDDDEDEWKTKRPRRKTKGLKVTFRSSCGKSRPPASHETQKKPMANAKIIADLQALERKRRHNEHGTRPIDALTFDKANIVASVGGQAAASER